MTDATWVFRVASNPDVGGGHVARSRALATALSTHFSVLFVLDRTATAWLPHLHSQGFDAICAGDGEPESCLGCILDGYNFGAKDIASWRSRAEWLVFIDDFGTRPPRIDLAVGAGLNFETAVNAEVPVLAGPSYALLDPVYRNVPTRDEPAQCHNILLCFGLRDSAGATGLAISALEWLAERREGWRPKITVVIGSHAPGIDSLKKQISATGLDVVVCEEASGLYQFLVTSDLFVGAGGQTLLERMAVGVPSVTVTVASNQRNTIRMAAADGATIDAGDRADLSAKCLAGQVDALARSVLLRRQMSTAGRRLVDGRGAERVAKAIVELTLGNGNISPKFPLQ